MTEVEQIEARLAQLETQRNANHWRCHMGASMNGYRPLPPSFYDERRRLQERLQKLRNIYHRGLDTL